METTGLQPWSARLSRLLWWLLPIFFLFWIDRDGLRVWFLQDDFAWLSLLRQVHRHRPLLDALFGPEAQGTIRPWSERGFFLVFESLFGLDSLPFRIWVFATMAANVALLAWIARRITGSRLAGVVAPIFWVANAALSTVLAWSSAYNEALCSLFLLSALALFVRFAETGRRIFWWCQLVVFTLGFGALEINVVYPALAAAYALCLAPHDRRRRLIFSLTPLFVISVIYFFLHRAVAPLPVDGPYAIHFDRRIFTTIVNYCKWALAPQEWPGHVLLRRRAFVWLMTGAVAAFSISELTKRRYVVLFCELWFLIALAPMLPIPDHITDYYLTIPLIGAAVLAAWGVASAWQSSWLWRVTVLLLAVLWLNVMITGSLSESHWRLTRSRNVRAMVLGAVAAREAHPDKTIVLDGVTSPLFEDAVAHSAFYAAGLDYVYLAPGSGDKLESAPHLEALPRVLLEPGVMKNAITHDEVVVYSVNGDHLRNITEQYERSAAVDFFPDERSGQGPRHVEVGNPLDAYLLGPEWFPLETGVRWMPQRATVRLRGPESGGDELLLEGDCPEQVLKAGPVHLSVSVDGIPLPEAEIGKTDPHFRRLYVVPASLLGRDSVEVVISVDRVYHEPGGRVLGLVFGTIAFER